MRRLLVARASPVARIAGGGRGQSAVLVSVADGRTLVTTRRPGCHYWWKVLAEVADVASRDHTLAAEFVLRLHESSVVSLRKRDNAAVSVPVCGFDRRDGSADVPVPHYYIIPDEICSDQKSQTPLVERKASIFARDSYFCGETPRPLPCQRTHFGLISRNATAVRASGVEWDVAVTNAVKGGGAYSGRLVSRPPRPLISFAEHRYLLSTDGWVSGGKLSQLLATGSVVLKPRSISRMYFEYLLEPNLVR